MHKESIALRFSDFDIAGHVHNAVFMEYFEQGRIGFFHKCISDDWDWKKLGLVVARNEIDYKAPVFFESKPVIETFLISYSESSFKLGYKMYDESSGTVYAVGASVMVCYNYASREKQAIPEEWKKLFDGLLSQ